MVSNGQYFTGINRKLLGIPALPFTLRFSCEEEELAIRPGALNQSQIPSLDAGEDGVELRW